MFQDEDTNELYWLIIGGPLLMGGLFVGGLSVLEGGLQSAVVWLIDHNVLVAAADAMIPIGDGGLDLPRIVFASSLLFLLLMMTLSLRRSPQA